MKLQRRRLKHEGKSTISGSADGGARSTTSSPMSAAELVAPLQLPLGRRQSLRGVCAGFGVAALVLLAIALNRAHNTSELRAETAEAMSFSTRRSARGGQKGSVSAVISPTDLSAGGENAAVPFQELSLAYLETRETGAAPELLKAYKEEMEAAKIFSSAVSKETSATRALSERAEYSPRSMHTALQTEALLSKNEAKMKELAADVKAAGEIQLSAKADFDAATAKRLKAVQDLNDELKQEAEDEYDEKKTVQGTYESARTPRFDPGPRAVARLVGVDSDGSTRLCGLAEVMHRGQWGKICSEGFDGIDAAVFCKSMGLIGGSARYTDGLKPTWGATSIQHMYEDKLGTSSIWMNHVKCEGAEESILDCPFGTHPNKLQDWRLYTASRDGCSPVTSVELCCDTHEFCPPRSQWRSDVHNYEEQGQMYGKTMAPEQMSPDMVANCKCDAGFYMDPAYTHAGLYSGKCTTCPLHSCAPVGSTRRDECACLEGYYKQRRSPSIGFECVACPANSCSPRGISDASGCKCFAGYYMSAGQCVACAESLTSRPASTKEAQCDLLCGLPKEDTVGEHAEGLADAAIRVAEQLAAQRIEADKYQTACEEESAALDALNAQMTYKYECLDEMQI
jgi:hypothetical protein